MFYHVEGQWGNWLFEVSVQCDDNAVHIRTRRGWADNCGCSFNSEYERKLLLEGPPEESGKVLNNRGMGIPPERVVGFVNAVRHMVKTVEDSIICQD